jgi:histidine triad (HIT) family protein
MNDATDCLFCRMVAGEIPADVVHDDARTLAFRDINPKAPTHVLVVPKEHHADVGAAVTADPALVADVLATAAAVARAEGLDGGYRVVANTGDDGGQTVHHLHVHVLGGRAMSWPPG